MQSMVCEAKTKDEIFNAAIFQCVKCLKRSEIIVRSWKDKLKIRVWSIIAISHSQ